MREQDIAQDILGTLRADNQPLRDRLYAVLTGALLAVGPPWPEDPEAYRLLNEVDRLMRQALRGLARLNPERGGGAGNMLLQAPRWRSPRTTGRLAYRRVAVAGYTSAFASPGSACSDIAPSA